MGKRTSKVLRIFVILSTDGGKTEKEVKSQGIERLEKRRAEGL